MKDVVYKYIDTSDVEHEVKVPGNEALKDLDHYVATGTVEKTYPLLEIGEKKVMVRLKKPTARMMRMVERVMMDELGGIDTSKMEISVLRNSIILAAHLESYDGNKVLKDVMEDGPIISPLEELKQKLIFVESLLPDVRSLLIELGGAFEAYCSALFSATACKNF